MPSTYTLIAGETLASSAASYTFSAIPSTYTDLVVRVSGRVDAAGIVADSPYIKLNGIGGTSYSNTRLLGDGASATSGRSSSTNDFTLNQGVPAASATANSFGSWETYIPNYAASASKAISTTAVVETNATTAYIRTFAQLFTDTTAISTILVHGGGALWIAGSSFYLYGIKKS